MSGRHNETQMPCRHKPYIRPDRCQRILKNKKKHVINNLGHMMRSLLYYIRTLNLKYYNPPKMVRLDMISDLFLPTIDCAAFNELSSFVPSGLTLLTN